MLLFIASKLFFFFHHILAVPRRVGQAALPSHLPACTLCSEFALPRSNEPQGFELKPLLKDNAVAVACNFEISNLSLFLKGALTRQRAKLSLSQFCFSAKNQKTQLTLFAPNQHAASLVADCRGVKHALFLYGDARFTKRRWRSTSFRKRKKERACFTKRPQFISTIRTYVLFFSSDAKYLSCICWAVMLVNHWATYCMSDIPCIPVHL